ncbi:LOW QUALITY PROTEIN: hypothetical protein U9M48_030516 [Paspalum notatum var. saurae]|uniref:Heat shock protein 70 n=1 Tax=Paspalum notatum var. saurae TaxID=547442 RepID=A0AAQ3U0X6_PASNO
MRSLYLISVAVPFMSPSTLLKIDAAVDGMDQGVFEVVATAGDTHLGRADFDNELVKYALKEFTQKHLINTGIFCNNKALRRLTACERAKRMLSFTAQITIEVDALHDGIDFSAIIIRSRFEELNKNLFSRFMKELEKCQRNAKMDRSSVHNVVLVGGSTCIPEVQVMLQEFFNGKELSQKINPDEAVAYSTVIQASILGGDTNDERLVNVLLHEVTPLSLGVEATHDRIMRVVIPRNTTILAKKAHHPLRLPDHRGISCGESASTKDNNLLGTFMVTGIPPALQAVPSFVVTFDIDANGVLSVTVKDLDTGRKSGITIINHGGPAAQGGNSALGVGG